MNHFYTKYYCFVLSFLITAIVCNAQFPDLKFDRISTTEGLSQSTVTSIVQDSLGFMWFGTYEGLNRYDGYNFKVYKVEDEPSNGLSDNFIKDLLVDSKGILWVATADGLNVYNQKKDKFFSFKNDEADNSSEADIVDNLYYKIVASDSSTSCNVAYSPSEGFYKIKINDGSVLTSVEEEIANEFYLYQNYPNPFNPETSIEYQVSRYEMIMLKVYDVIGNEIASLVNEIKTPGKYKVKFDGSNLSSGVYLYRLQAGNYVQTRKLLLMK